MVVHTFNLGGRSRLTSEFEARLVYRVTSRTARTTQKNPVWTVGRLEAGLELCWGQSCP